MTLESLALQGRARTYSTLAASVSARIPELRKYMIRESLLGFRHSDHRMENVANIHGIEFINDSGACTLNSTWYALESIHRPVIWITGGTARGSDYSMVRELVERKVKAIILLGEGSQSIMDLLLTDDIPVFRVRTMAEAVETGYYIGKKGDTVLLSPACASFEMFENFEARGDAFRQAVKKL